MDLTEFVNVLLSAYELLSGDVDDERIENVYCVVVIFCRRS